METVNRNELSFVRTRRGLWLAALVVLACAAPSAARSEPQSAPTLTVRAGSMILHGESPRLLVTGLTPQEKVVLHSFRLTQEYGIGKSPINVVAHAFAEFTADREGRVDVDNAAPLRGTYTGADPLGLFWSGEKAQPADGVKLSSSNDVVFQLERDLKVIAQAQIIFGDGADRVEVEDVVAPGLNGAFAQPKGAGSRPAIILLHGSSGGSRDLARASAIKFAQLGYAAFALSYFAPPYAHIEGIPQAPMNIPVEGIEKARAWMQAKPNVRADRVALYGTSKGAELALIAAAHYEWVDRVVACAPSDVVWSGFGRPAVPGEEPSSWTVAGRSLAFVPYDGFEDYEQGRLSLTGIHLRSLERTPQDRIEAARIPIERTKAKLLLLGASRDEAWPSGDMTRRIEATMKKNGRASQVTALVFEEAGHYFFAGAGDQPTRINPGFNPEGEKPLPEATARAAAQTWSETKRFLTQ